MPKELQNINLEEFDLRHSEEAEEILGNIPGWIVRWGITLFFILFAGIIVGCYFIKFPQTVKAPIIITSENPPARLVARSSGKIDTIFVANGSQVAENTPIALLHNTALYADVSAVTDSLRKDYADGSELALSGWLDTEYSLGELQAPYLEFRRICLDYRHYLEAGSIERKQKLLSDQIVKNRAFYARQQTQKQFLLEDISYNYISVQRDSALRAEGAISGAQYYQTIQNLLQKQSSMESFEAGLINTELDILQMEQQLVELSVQINDETAAYERQLNNSRQQLLAQVEAWRHMYLIISPINGRMTFANYWSSNQTVQAGEHIGSVSPGGSMNIIGRMTVPTSGFGKVAVGQTVNIKLNGYPNMEYGMVKGSVSSISNVPETSGTAVGYIVNVILPSPLVTTYNKELDLIQEMDGTGEIITKDQRLVMRFIQPITALFDK